MISWSFGVNSVAAYAADNGDLPKYFGKRSGKNNMPTGAAVMNGLLASAIVIIGALLPESDLFWSFFALNLVMLLVSYVVMFPAFLKLRKIDGDTERPFRVPGGSGMLRGHHLCADDSSDHFHYLYGGSLQPGLRDADGSAADHSRNDRISYHRGNYHPCTEDSEKFRKIDHIPHERPEE